MFTSDLKNTLFTFYISSYLHTLFYYVPSARLNINQPIDNVNVRHAFMGFNAHLENYVWDNFSSPAEEFDMVASLGESIKASKKYMIPGYLSNTIISCVKTLLSSPQRDNYGFIEFINGILMWMPDDLLKKEIYNIAKQKGLTVLGI